MRGMSQSQPVRTRHSHVRWVVRRGLMIRVPGQSVEKRVYATE